MYVPLACRRAVKIVKKRFLGGYLEDHFVRRVQHEVRCAEPLRGGIPLSLRISVVCPGDGRSQHELG